MKGPAVEYDPWGDPIETVEVHPGQTVIPDAPQPAPDPRCHWCGGRADERYRQVNISPPGTKTKNRIIVDCCAFHYETVVERSLRAAEQERQEKLAQQRILKKVYGSH